ncbi:MAG: response regulator [Azospirillum sp.]|nr:response regulator [Azospirillum sp.]
MNEAHRVAVIEDDPQLRRFLTAGLEAHGYQVSCSESGRAGIASIVTVKPDVILLDLGLPDIDGTALIDEIRAWSQIPIIVVSSRIAVGDKISALDHGASDYVTKPFDMGELLARIRASLRQNIRTSGTEPTFTVDHLVVDLLRREVRRDGALVKLSPREFALLRFLVANADKVLTHQMILKEVWGAAHLHDTHYLRIFIGRLRQKLELDPARPRLIVTESGVGYRLRVNRPEERMVAATGAAAHAPA